MLITLKKEPPLKAFYFLIYCNIEYILKTQSWVNNDNLVTQYIHYNIVCKDMMSILLKRLLSLQQTDISHTTNTCKLDEKLVLTSSSLKARVRWFLKCL